MCRSIKPSPPLRPASSASQQADGSGPTVGRFRRDVLPLPETDDHARESNPRVSEIIDRRDGQGSRKHAEARRFAASRPL